MRSPTRASPPSRRGSSSRPTRKRTGRGSSTPDQEKNWPGVEQAIRDLAKDRYERRTERRNEPRPADPIERLRSRADTMTKTAADLKRLADAADPLYQSLNEDQKHRLFFLVRSMRGHHMAMHWREHRGFDRD